MNEDSNDPGTAPPTPAGGSGMRSDDGDFYDNIDDMDAFDILRVREDASDEVIRSAYLKLALIYHPDKAKNSSNIGLSSGGSAESCSSSSSTSNCNRIKVARPNNANIFNKINEAWTLLQDPKSRDSLRISRLVANKSKNFELNCEMLTLDEFGSPLPSGSFSKDCRCGGHYEFTQDDLDDDLNTFQCSNCSLYVSILPK